MRVISSRQSGDCALCDAHVLVGHEIISYLGQWVHAACAIDDFTNRSSHSDGYTYFLLLGDGTVKIGWSARMDTLKQRIRRAHKTIGPVSQVLGVHHGGETLKAFMHYRFAGVASGRTETFLGTVAVRRAALGGADRKLTRDAQDFLIANSPNWV